MDFHFQIREAGNVLQGLFYLLRFGLKDMQVRSGDPNDDAIAGPGENLSDSLLEVGLHVTNQSGVAIYGFLNSPHGLIIVRRWINADPVLGEIDPIRLVRQSGLTDVRAGVADAWNGQQFGAGSLRDPEHFWMGGARRGDPVHQEVPFLERGKQIAPHERQHRESGQHDGHHGKVGATRAGHDWL